MEREKLDYVLNVPSDFSKEYEASKNDNVNSVPALYFVAKLEEGVTLEQIVSFSEKRFKYNVKESIDGDYNELYANSILKSSDEMTIEIVHGQGHDSHDKWGDNEYHGCRKANVDFKVENGYLIGRASLGENRYRHISADRTEYSYSKDVSPKAFKEEFLEVYLDALKINLLTKGGKDFITRNPDKVQAFGKENGVNLSAEYKIAKVSEYNPAVRLQVFMEIESEHTSSASKDLICDVVKSFAEERNFTDSHSDSVVFFLGTGECRNKVTDESFHLCYYSSIEGYFSEESMLLLIDKLNEKNILYSLDVYPMESKDFDAVIKVREYDKEISESASKSKDVNNKSKLVTKKKPVEKTQEKDDGISL